MIEIVEPTALDEITADGDLKRLYRYWIERRGARTFPARAQIDPIEFGFALGRVSLVDVLEGSRRFYYRLVSTRMTEHLGYEMTGKFLDELPEGDVRVYAQRFYSETLKRRAPLFHRDGTVLDSRRCRHEALSLPLSSDGRTIDMLMIYRVTGMPVRVAAAE